MTYCFSAALLRGGRMRHDELNAAGVAEPLALPVPVSVRVAAVAAPPPVVVADARDDVSDGVRFTSSVAAL